MDNNNKIIKMASEWKIDVLEKESDIDPNQEEVWYSMALGYALGKGEQPDTAYVFANYLTENRLI